MFTNFEQVSSGGFNFEEKPKLKRKLHIKNHNLIQSLGTAEATGKIADRKIKLNFFILIQSLLISFENTSKISKDNLTNQIHPTSQIIY